jgi:transposase-like protein
MFRISKDRIGSRCRSTELPLSLLNGRCYAIFVTESSKRLAENKKKGAPLGNKRALGNRGGGRKPKYQAAMARIARKACERGMTDLEVANLLDVSASTLYRWRTEYPQFARLFRLGKIEADNRVERALFSRAVGYDYEVEKQIMTRRGPQMLRWREHMPPDVAAALAYLRNRRPDRWRDTHRIEHTRSPYDHIESTAELRALLQEQARRLGLVDPPVLDVRPTRKTEPVASETPQMPTDPIII